MDSPCPPLLSKQKHCHHSQPSALCTLCTRLLHFVHLCAVYKRMVGRASRKHLFGGDPLWHVIHTLHACSHLLPFAHQFSLSAPRFISRVHTVRGTSGTLCSLFLLHAPHSATNTDLPYHIVAGTLLCPFTQCHRHGHKFAPLLVIDSLSSRLPGLVYLLVCVLLDQSIVGGGASSYQHLFGSRFARFARDEPSFCASFVGTKIPGYLSSPSEI